MRRRSTRSSQCSSNAFTRPDKGANYSDAFQSAYGNMQSSISTTAIYEPYSKPPAYTVFESSPIPDLAKTTEIPNNKIRARPTHGIQDLLQTRGHLSYPFERKPTSDNKIEAEVEIKTEPEFPPGLALPADASAIDVPTPLSEPVPTAPTACPSICSSPCTRTSTRCPSMTCDPCYSRSKCDPCYSRSKCGSACWSKPKCVSVPEPEVVSTSDADVFYQELIDRRCTDIHAHDVLPDALMRDLSKGIKISIFDDSKCCEWDATQTFPCNNITDMINRLYLNYVDPTPLAQGQVIMRLCDPWSSNCLNVKHMNKCWTAKGPIMPSADEVTTILIKKSEIEDIPLIDKSEIVPIPEPVIEADTVTTPSPLDLLSEMIQRQITDGCIDKKLDINDMKRICKYINTSIFGTDCCLWQGYITNQSSANKGTYVNFYFQERKVALHRLLYDNFVEEVSKENEYIKFTCSNAGTCCNVNHMSKHRYEAKVPTKPEAKPVCKQSPVVAHRNISDIGHMMITNKLPAKTDMKICGNTTAVMEDNNYNSNTLYQSNEFGAKSTDSGQEVNASEPVSSTGVGGYSWPQLTAKNINTTFKVVGDLKEGLKVKVVDDTCLAVDDAYISSFSRYMSGQSKEKTMSFLDHLLSESKRIIYALLSDIRTSYANSNGNNDEVNNKLSELRNLHRNLNIFLHKFDAMKNVYKSDSVAYATFGNIRNNFYTFEDSFYRELVLGSVRH